MRNTESNDAGLTLVSEYVASGGSARALSREVGRGTLLRLRRGVYADQTLARALGRRERYLLSIEAAVLTRRRRPVVGFDSAAAVWGCDRWGGWPSEVHLIVGPSETQSRTESVRSHRYRLEPGDVVEVNGMLVTSYARTLIDLARTSSRNQSLLALDEALSIRRRDNRRVLTRAALLDELRNSSTSRGQARARDVIDFADGASANGGESYSRLLLRQFGFEPPQLQTRHANPHGGSYFTDFEWSDRRLVAEFDGHSKYLKPEYLGTMTPGEAVVAEKIREDHIRAQGFRFVRWGVPDLREPARLRSLLLAAGAPLAKP
ncbi:MAG: hypothetical protein JWQ19_934 [Subtercola sp.]|nr:hypothetical protein [Subtercola sp.]